MSLRYRMETLRIPFRDPFRIARELATKPEGGGQVATTVILTLWDTADGIGGPVGVGEGFPDTYYGETPQTISAVMPLLVSTVEASIERTLTADREHALRAMEGAEAAMDTALARNGAAKAALDIALYDLVSRRLGITASELLGTAPEIGATDFSLGIDEPRLVAERAARAAASARFAALKVKVGSAADMATLEAVRGVYQGPLRVDANTGWQPDEAERLLPELERLGVELIEQPFPANRRDQLGRLQERSSLPIVADESAVTIDDLEGLRGVVAGVNVKLMKCGGIGPARRMLERASQLGFRTFLGCMEETSVGIAASVTVAGLAEWLDLDGCLLLAHDPFEGLELGPDARWRLPHAREWHGLGVRAAVDPFKPMR